MSREEELREVEKSSTLLELWAAAYRQDPAAAGEVVASVLKVVEDAESRSGANLQTTPREERLRYTNQARLGILQV